MREAAPQTNLCLVTCCSAGGLLLLHPASHRAARKQRGESYHPRWFSRTPGSPAASLITLAHSANPPAPPAWTYGGDYWRAAAAGEWDGCPDIY